MFLIEKSLALAAIIDKEDEARGSDSSSSEDSDDDNDEKKWDCATILSTYTNTDNHPAVVKTAGRTVRTKQRIELHKQFKVPLDGLMAEEISTLGGKRKAGEKKAAIDGPY